MSQECPWRGGGRHLTYNKPTGTETQQNELMVLKLQFCSRLMSSVLGWVLLLRCALSLLSSNIHDFVLGCVFFPVDRNLGCEVWE